MGAGESSCFGVGLGQADRECMLRLRLGRVVAEQCPVVGSAGAPDRTATEECFGMSDSALVGGICWQRVSCMFV